MTTKTTRRGFLSTASATGVAILASPAIATSKTRSASEVIIGEGAHRYRVVHQWAQLPSPYTWQTTHNVAVDSNNHLYVIHEGLESKVDHPSIFVFDERGKLIRSFGQELQGGGHGLEVRKEGSEEFLYVTGYQKIKLIAKMTLQGKTVWSKKAPTASGKYNTEEYDSRAVWGRDRFLPTNFAFLDDGGFLLADGYGAYTIHRYDKDAKWVSCFGGVGKGEGTFNTPHGLWIDQRIPSNPRIVVTDRANNTLQRFALDGTYIDTIGGFGLPANIDVRGDWMLVPELKARLSILDREYKVVAQLGDDVARINAKEGNTIRNDESKWVDGKFVHPHDACFDQEGNIFVAEWVKTGRVTKLIKV